VEGTDHVAATLVLNRPEQLNAIDWPMLDAIDAALDDLADDPLRAASVTGAGRALGGDLVGYQTLPRPRKVPRHRELHRSSAACAPCRCRWWPCVGRGCGRESV
jgi:enoyl-CoA hydratase/carnithine racemase